jgi:hypothetical protein
MFLEIYKREQDVYGFIHFVVCVFHGWGLGSQDRITLEDSAIAWGRHCWPACHAGNSMSGRSE